MWLIKTADGLLSQPRWRRFPAFAVLGALASLGQAPFDLPIVSLGAFALAILLLGRLDRPKKAATFGWFFALGYFAFGMQWLISPFLVEPEKHAWMAPFALFFMAGGLGLFWGAAFGLARKTGRASALIVTLPLAEMARAYVFTGFPWGMPSYGLTDSILAMPAAWIGSHGLNVMFLALAALLAFSVQEAGRLRLAAAAVGVAGFAALFVAPSPQGIEADRPVLRLVQPNAPQHLKWEPDWVPVFFDRALKLTEAGETPPDLIIWPETSLPAVLNFSQEARQQIAKFANGVPTVVGANRFQGQRLMNTAALLNAEGEVTQIYDKHHLVPFGEYVPFGDLMARFGIYGMAASQGQGFSAGPGPVLMDLGPVGRALPLICYEAVFPQDVGGAADRPDFLMQITNDAWFGAFSGPYQHLAQARMRAIERGLPMVRVANTGISALIDAQGQIVQSLPLNEAGYIDVSLPVAKPATVYARTGDFPTFGALCALFGLLWLRRDRKAIDPTSTPT